MNVHGKTIDAFTRCTHYHSEKDIIAIKFPCCDTYYACFQCHEEEADHPPQQISEHNFSNKHILCGACQSELTVEQYMESDFSCPNCGSAFNPGCKNHSHLYFSCDIERD